MGKTILVSKEKQGKTWENNQQWAKKGGKKKWSKGKVKDKLNNKVFLDEPTWKAIQKDMPNMGLITTATVSDKFKIIGSLARPLIKQFYADGKIKKVGSGHRTLPLFSGEAYLAKR